MLEGWYCRSIANNAAEVEDDEEDSPEEDVPNYKEQYRKLKKKLKFLIYENECFQEALRSTQRKLLKVNRDKSFLLDRLLQYEKVDTSYSESDETESSEDEAPKVEIVAKKRKAEPPITSQGSTVKTPPATAKKKKPMPKPPKVQNNVPLQTNSVSMVSMMSDGHMTPEEVERHLESRQNYLELVPEKAPPTVPTEMFSNDPSLDSETNDIGELETSPSNVGEDCLSVEMMGD